MRKISGYMPTFLLCCPWGSPGLAAQLAVNFQARVEIVTSCSVTSGQLDFGSVGTIIGGEAAVSAVNVVCSAGTPYTISFSSLSTVTSYTGSMVNGANTVAYSAALSAAGGIGPGTLTINGVLPAQATPPSALYKIGRAHV